MVGNKNEMNLVEINCVQNNTRFISRTGEHEMKQLVNYKHMQINYDDTIFFDNVIENVRLDSAYIMSLCSDLVKLYF